MEIDSQKGVNYPMDAGTVGIVTVDSSTCFAQSQIRATFYPKFENEKSDKEIRERMIELVSKGLATLEVSIKHSGSLFMYAGHNGGAYAKNSFGNIYTAVGVFVLGREFKEAWGLGANTKQAEFNDFLETNRMCISMELVTAVLGDHGQRPREDYVVVTAVTELGNGKPRFYSTPEIIAFCQKWRLPTNQVWLFSTRKSVTNFFAAYDSLYEEGTATPVCKALDRIADISIPGSKDHIKVQGEILEGLVARIVRCDSSKHMEDVLRDYPPPRLGAGLDLGSNLRDICAANRSTEENQIKALLESVGSSFCPDTVDWFRQGSSPGQSLNVGGSVVTEFLQAVPADYSTAKLQEMIRQMDEKTEKKKCFPVAFKCYHNMHKVDSISKGDKCYKMVIHVQGDSGFSQYQKLMRLNPALWPLYRGFFVDINLFKAKNERAAEILKDNNGTVDHGRESGADANAVIDEDANLMMKLKFLTYKLRTFLIRNGLSKLLGKGPGEYKTYCMRQMKQWSVSTAKQEEMNKMLDEWAVLILNKYGKKRLSSTAYLSVAEPFLVEYAKRSAANQALVGSAGSSVRSEDFLPIVGSVDEEGDLDREQVGIIPQGLTVFFPGIPGCAKSALCKELLNNPDNFGNNRPVQTFMGDLIKVPYWPKIAEERHKKPYSIILADKNAPNESVWKQIEIMCRSTKSLAVPVVPDSEGTSSNPFSLDALAIFMCRVLQRVNHPGKLDKANPNAGYVMLMFYNLYAGKNRREFEGELIERFGSLVKMPLVRFERNPLPDAVKSVLQEGIALYKLHFKRHRKLDSTKGAYINEWAKWEKQIRDTISDHAKYLNSIQVPFELAVSKVLEQLKSIATEPSTSLRKLGSRSIYAAITLPADVILNALENISTKEYKVKKFLKKKPVQETLKTAHVTLAHKKLHGITALEDYESLAEQKVDVELTALLFSTETAAIEVQVGSVVDGPKLECKNEWPHVTVWTKEGVAAKEANKLHTLHLQGDATRVEFGSSIVVRGQVKLF